MDYDKIAMLRSDDVERLENVLDDTPVPGHTRRSILRRAAAGAVAAGAAGALGPASGAVARGRHDSIKTVIDTAVTAEALAVTYLTGLVENAQATGVTQFVDVLKAANAAELDHYRALRKLGATPLTKRFWAPDAFFTPGNVFATIEVAETLFIDAYLIATTVFARAGKPQFARYAGEILGVEAEHRALARFAQNKLPNNVGFESYAITSMSGIVGALEKAGVGFGKQGATPGKFYEFATPPASAVTRLDHTTPR